MNVKKDDKQSLSNDVKPKWEMYSGDVRIKLEKVEDYIQVNRFCEILRVLTNMKITSYNWSEKGGLNITISLKDPLPLEDTIERLPMIESITKKKKEIIIVFNCYSPETVFPVFSNSTDLIQII